MQVPASKQAIANAISACEYVNVFGTDRNEKREQSSDGYCIWLSIYLWGGGRHEGRFSDCRHIGLPTKPCRGLNRQSRSSRNASASGFLGSLLPYLTNSFAVTTYSLDVATTTFRPLFWVASSELRQQLLLEHNVFTEEECGLPSLLASIATINAGRDKSCPICPTGQSRGRNRSGEIVSEPNVRFCSDTHQSNHARLASAWIIYLYPSFEARQNRSNTALAGTNLAVEPSVL